MGYYWMELDTIRVLKAMGVVSRQALDKGRSRTEALTEGGLFGLHAFGPREDGKQHPLPSFGPSVALAWLESSFATVEIGHKLAASLMCTGISPEVISEVVPPWRCFSIRIPEGILSEPQEVVVLFGHGGIVSTFRFTRWGVDFGAEKALKGHIEHSNDTTAPSWEAHGELAAFGDIDMPVSIRESRLVARLICGVCIEMDTPQIKDRMRVGARYTRGLGRKGDPSSWIFKLTRPVQIDLRNAVAEYARGDRGGKLSLQHLVRGHHKRQAHGLGLAERKWVHIEPYWRGDADAPIALRTHQWPREG